MTQTAQPESNVIPITHRVSIASPQRFKAHNFAASLQFAIHGLFRILQTERNFRIHLGLTLLVVSAAAYFQVSLAEWAILALCIGLMLAVEALNTAIEYTVDLITGGIYHETAKHAKDAAAGACLLVAISTAIVGACIFLPHLWQQFLH